MIIRGIQIMWTATRLLLDVLSAMMLNRMGFGRRMTTLPQRTTRRLENLGPTFTKLGQALSERRDILDANWAASLSNLQSKAAPFPADAAVGIIEQSLAANTATAFAGFEREPLAAGSVAQVHAAKLHDGREVVVKVLRPGVGEQIARDMRILLILVHLFQHVIPALRRHRAAALAKELSHNLKRETDFRQEARNIRLFARAFADSETVYIPDVVDEMSDASVITQERSMGTPLDEREAIERGNTLTETFIDFYLQQFFVLGAFHADPHPGNLLIMSDGRLCVHDFGAVGRLDIGTREALLGFVAAFIYLDSEWLTDAAIDLGLLSVTADRAALTRGVDGILAELRGAAMSEWSLAKTMLDIGRLSGYRTLSLPPHLAALVRTVFTAESTLRKLNPEADLLLVLQATGNRLLAERRSAAIGNLHTPRLEWEIARLVRRAPAIGAGWLQRVSAGTAGHPSGSLAPGNRLDHAVRQVALSIAALGSYLASAALMVANRGPRVLGDIPLPAAIILAAALLLTIQILIQSRRQSEQQP